MENTGDGWSEIEDEMYAVAARSHWGWQTCLCECFLTGLGEWEKRLCWCISHCELGAASRLQATEACSHSTSLPLSLNHVIVLVHYGFLLVLMSWSPHYKRNICVRWGWPLGQGKVAACRCMITSASCPLISYICIKPNLNLFRVHSHLTNAICAAEVALSKAVNLTMLCWTFPQPLFSWVDLFALLNSISGRTHNASLPLTAQLSVVRFHQSF